MAKRAKRKTTKISIRKEIRKAAKEADKIDDEFDISKNLEKDTKEIEKWMVERKKFLVKLGWVVGLITILLLVSHFYLRVKGFG